MLINFATGDGGMVNEMQHIIEEMGHRIHTLDKHSRELKSMQRKTGLHRDELGRTIEREARKIRAELSEIEDIIDETARSIEGMGKQLRRCIRRDEFEEVQTAVDEWNLPKLLSKKSLDEDFKHFSQRPSRP